MPRKPTGAKRHQTGIRAIHSRKCATRHDSEQCDCRPAWEASVYLRREGKKVRKTFPALAEAKRWRHHAGAANSLGELLAPKRSTLDQAADEWIAGAKTGAIRNRSGDVFKPSMLRGYEQALTARVLPALGAHQVADIRRPRRAGARRALAGAEARPVHDPEHARAATRGYRHHADDVPINPTVGARLPAVRGTRDRIADPAEAQALLDMLAPADRAVSATAMYAGRRLGELRALRWTDVDLAGGVIRVERSWDDRAGVITPKSRAGTRKVPIVPVLRDLLAELRCDGGDGLAFSAGERPFHPGGLAKRARRAWLAAELEPITLHECRHTFESLMIAAGVNAKAPATYIGHASVTITFDRYGHLMPGNDAEAATLLDAYLTRADTAARPAMLDA